MGRGLNLPDPPIRLCWYSSLAVKWQFIFFSPLNTVFATTDSLSVPFANIVIPPSYTPLLPHAIEGWGGGGGGGYWSLRSTLTIPKNLGMSAGITSTLLQYCRVGKKSWSWKLTCGSLMCCQLFLYWHHLRSKTKVTMLCIWHRQARCTLWNPFNLSQLLSWILKNKDSFLIFYTVHNTTDR